ncbi:MAG: hypothetical protein HRU30_09485 [Rhodobacteraceae bacterium]|nr:hypothetical protein [Paracoccaceae bacterium]
MACTDDGNGPVLAFGDAQGGGLFAPAAPKDQIALMGGDVVLVAPDGFCVDTRSKRRNFALMARCDVLGGDSQSSNAAPLAILTASVVPVADDTTLTETVAAERKDRVLDISDDDGLFLTRLKSDPPSDAFRNDFWRGSANVGVYVLRLGAYSAKGAPVLGPYGRVLLEESLTFTRAASQTSAAATN